MIFFQSNKFLVFLFIFGIFGITHLCFVLLPVAVDGIMCMTREPIEYTGTAKHMCEDFGNYALIEIFIRLFN